MDNVMNNWCIVTSILINIIQAMSRCYSLCIVTIQRNGAVKVITSIRKINEVGHTFLSALSSCWTNKRSVRIFRFLFKKKKFCSFIDTFGARYTVVVQPHWPDQETGSGGPESIHSKVYVPIVYTHTANARRVIKTLKVNWNNVMDSWRRCVGRSRRGRKRNLHRQADIARDTATVGSLHDGVGGRRDRVTFLGAKHDRSVFIITDIPYIISVEIWLYWVDGETV